MSSVFDGFVPSSVMMLAGIGTAGADRSEVSVSMVDWDGVDIVMVDWEMSSEYENVEDVMCRRMKYQVGGDSIDVTSTAVIQLSLSVDHTQLRYVPPHKAAGICDETRFSAAN